MNTGRFVAAWGRILAGRPPMLSIEITRECPLKCPGCYAYDAQHLGGGVTLRQLSDLRGHALVDGVLQLVQQHRPVHVSLVGGEPLVRHRELSQILSELSAWQVETLIVTSGVIPIPVDWNRLKHIRVAVSVDGLAPDHDVRRFPATYERILSNIRERRVDISWVITRPQTRASRISRRIPRVLERSAGGRSDLVEPVHAAGWRAQPRNVDAGPPSMAGVSPARAARPLPRAAHDRRHGRGARASAGRPRHCVFSRMSINYSADLQTQVQPLFLRRTAGLQPVRLRRHGGAALDWHQEVPWRARGAAHGGLDSDWHRNSASGARTHVRRAVKICQRRPVGYQVRT